MWGEKLTSEVKLRGRLAIASDTYSPWTFKMLVVFLVMNLRKVQIEIKYSDIVMLQVAIEERVKTWQRTQLYWQKLEESNYDHLIYVDGDIEEANSLTEADNMVKLWVAFSGEIFDQLK